MSDAKIETMVMITGREYEALRAEVERLKEQLESPFTDGYETAKEEYRPRLIAAEAENEKLRAGLRQIAGIDVWDNSEQGYVDKARAALEGK